jgi:nicotinate-nucleotide adenylyltransferase
MTGGPLRVLVFGGSFNPVHWGHLALAESVREEWGYDLVLLVPASRSPFKDGRADPGPQERLEMLRLACADNPGFSVDDRELLRGGTSFTIDTIRELVKEGWVAGRPGLLLGDDLVDDFPKWRECEALAREAQIIVARRSGPLVEAAFPCKVSANRVIPVSSSEIRERIKSGRSIRYLVPEAVRLHIAARGLYA